MAKPKEPPHPEHVRGIHRGEEYAKKEGREHGRGCPGDYRSSRDSTGINPKKHAPILPGMPSIPPA